MSAPQPLPTSDPTGFDPQALHAELQAVIRQTPDRAGRRLRLLQSFTRLINAAGSALSSANEGEGVRLLSRQLLEWLPDAETIIGQAAERVQRERRALVVSPTVVMPLQVIAAPLDDGDVLAVFLICERKDVDPFLVLVQMAAGYFSLGDAEQAIRSDRLRRQWLNQWLNSRDRQEAGMVLVNALRQQLDCRQVVLAGQRPAGAVTEAIAGVSGFHLEGEFSRIAQRVVETRWQETDAVASARADLPSDDAGRQWLEQADCDWLISLPLVGPAGKSGHLFMLAEAPRPVEITDVLGIDAAAVGHFLAVFDSAEQHFWPRWRLQVSACARRRPAWFVAAAVGLLLLPWPYHIDAGLVIEPKLRRVVVAPFDAVLAAAKVRPGDEVHAGDVLAMLDGSDIQLELNAVSADREKAEKQADTALAAGDVAAAQIGRLERERLTLRLDLLSNRRRQLDIVSPIDGVIVGGEQMRVEGKPVSEGSPLFEVAPLAAMLAEVAIPDADIAYVKAGASVDLQLAAYSGDVIETSIARVHPRSESRDGRNVFIAEAELDNSAGRLKPGMEGVASVSGPWRPLGWVLFHKPWAALRRVLPW